MGNTEVKGKVITIAQPAHMLYTGFSDMRNFVMALPPDKKEGVTATEDTIEGEVKGFKMGIRVVERNPFSSIVYEQFGKSPFPFTISIFFNAVDVAKTEFHIELSAELNFMIKSMLGGKLQEVVDAMTDQLGLAFSGKLDMSKFNPGNVTYS
jgi:hypothetical protein